MSRVALVSLEVTRTEKTLSNTENHSIFNRELPNKLPK